MAARTVSRAAYNSASIKPSYSIPHTNSALPPIGTLRCPTRLGARLAGIADTHHGCFPGEKRIHNWCRSFPLGQAVARLTSVSSLLAAVLMDTPNSLQMLTIM